jgi:hypothetical protein
VLQRLLLEAAAVERLAAERRVALAALRVLVAAGVSMLRHRGERIRRKEHHDLANGAACAAIPKF